MLIVRIAVARPLAQSFFYRVKEEWRDRAVRGNWVSVPFGRSQVRGVILSTVPVEEARKEWPDLDKLKEVSELGELEQALPPAILELCEWASRYYVTPLGEILGAAVPPSTLGLKNKKREPRELKHDSAPPEIKTLTDEQKLAVESIRQAIQENPSAPPVFLLKGVTGSGKTEVYLELAREMLAQGKGVLFLVPEIALTNQLVTRVERGLGEKVAEWHSGLSDGKRRDVSAYLRSGKLRVVIGARSALFAPVKDLGLLIVDEEHDATFKQEDRVRYQARDLSIVRGKIEKIPVLLGSATPSLESLERVREGKYRFLELKNRFSHQGLPDLEMVSLREEPLIEGIQAMIAEKTLERIRETIARGEQVMVFLNRRGFAPFLLCESCGEVENCPNCSISLTFHMKPRSLKCHLCGYKALPPDECPKCQSIEIRPQGAGTESLEEELPKLLPDVVIDRLDRDVVTSQSRLDEILGNFRSGKTQLLIGTQMLVKGHDFPNVTLVVVLFADSLFRFPDFRANERAYQTLLQVIGRSGRGDKKGVALIQTYEPEHPIFEVLQGIVSEEDFIEHEREQRQELGYSPFGRMARVRVDGKRKDETLRLAEDLADTLRGWILRNETEFCEILGPSDSFIERVNDLYRFDLLIKSQKAVALQKCISVARDWATRKETEILLDVDPYGMS